MLWAVFAVMAAALLALFALGDDLDIAGMDSDQFAGLVFYGLLLTLLASGFIAGRERFGTLVKQAIIWLAIIVACVAGYEYRFELQNIASRVTAGLVPGVAITSTDENGGTTVQISKNNRHFQTDGSINGQIVSFIVDTGASTVVLTYSSAAKAGLDPQSLNFNIPVSTANGVTVAAPVRLETLSIGGIERNNIAALIAEEGQLFENLLGMNFLDTLSGFDVRRERLVLRD